MTRVMVTGATTPIGMAVIDRLLARDEVEHVLAVGFEKTAPPIPDYGNNRYTYFRCDLTRQRRLRRMLFGPVRDLEVDSIIHLALHRSAAATGARVHALNVESTRELLHLAERHPTICRFVFRSFGEVYDVRPERPVLLGEEDPLNLSPDAPQWVRDRVEADLTVCTRIGVSPLSIAVLRCAECLAAGVGSQLHDYLQSGLCFRPFGFDPILNLMTIEDMARALVLTLFSASEGVFTIPGADTLPLSDVIQKWGRKQIALPGPLIAPIYWARRLIIGSDFNYRLNLYRFHFGGVLSGARASRELGYRPGAPIRWPCP